MNYTYIIFEETESQKKLTTQGHTIGQWAKNWVGDVYLYLEQQEGRPV